MSCIAAIAQEYRAKPDDVACNDALRVTVEWVQTSEQVIPAHRQIKIYARWTLTA